MTSYVFGFWSSQQSTQQSKPQPTLRDLINELKDFQENKGLKKVAIQPKSIKGPSKEWKELLEKREKIINGHGPVINGHGPVIGQNTQNIEVKLHILECDLSTFRAGIVMRTQQDLNDIDNMLIRISELKNTFSKF